MPHTVGTPGVECLSPQVLTGDNGLTLIENAPWGVVASVTPSTNPAATVINNAISLIAAGIQGASLIPQSFTMDIKLAVS